LAILFRDWFQLTDNDGSPDQLDVDSDNDSETAVITRVAIDIATSRVKIRLMSAPSLTAGPITQVATPQPMAPTLMAMVCATTVTPTTTMMAHSTP
jgi:hypothetical protein